MNNARFDEHMTGFIDEANDNLMFYNDGYVFHIFPKKIIAFQDFERTPYIVKHNDGFVTGITHRNRRIAICVNLSAFNIIPSFNYQTDMFLSAEFPDGAICPFETIVFSGGILNNLQLEHSINFSDYSDQQMVIENKKFSKIYSIEGSEHNFKFEIGYHTGSIEYTNKITAENKPYLSLCFNKEQPLSSIMIHYRKIKQLISFMTFQQDNCFDEIYILPKKDTPNRYRKKVFVHLQENETGAETGFHRITFNQLGDCIGELVRLIYDNKLNKPSISLGFIPQNKNAMDNHTDDEIRAVCAALECEMLVEKRIGESQSKALSELCDSVKKLIKEHQTAHSDSPVLSDGTYSLINNSVTHWSMSAYEKTIALYDLNAEAISRYTETHFKSFNKEWIRDLIKYRNSITHGTYQVLTPNIKKTVKCMEALVYCSILSRIGVPKETINRLCETEICK